MFGGGASRSAMSLWRDETSHLFEFGFLGTSLSWRSRCVQGARAGSTAPEGARRERGDGSPWLDARRRHARVPRGGARRFAWNDAPDPRLRAPSGRLVLHRFHRRGSAPHCYQSPRESPLGILHAVLSRSAPEDATHLRAHRGESAEHRNISIGFWPKWMLPNQNCFGKNPLIFAILLAKGRPIVNVAENQIFVYQPK